MAEAKIKIRWHGEQDITVLDDPMEVNSGHDRVVWRTYKGAPHQYKITDIKFYHSAGKAPGDEVFPHRAWKDADDEEQPAIFSIKGSHYYGPLNYYKPIRDTLNNEEEIELYYTVVYKDSAGHGEHEEDPTLVIKPRSKKI